jgi:hypothetical protein
MYNRQEPERSVDAPASAQPPKTRLRRILEERPEARPRIGRAVAELLGIGLVSLVALAALVIWHIARRGRLIRERLSPPRAVPPLEPPYREADL